MTSIAYDETDKTKRGWDVFLTNGDGPALKYAIQRCDETNRFTSDQEAFDHVCNNPAVATICIHELLDLLLK